jgi:hypothetical protein
VKLLQYDSHAGATRPGVRGDGWPWVGWPTAAAANQTRASCRSTGGVIGCAAAALSRNGRRDTLFVDRMPSLLQVLHDATGHGATEIVLEAGRAPTMRTNLGVEQMKMILSEGELFDALGGVLGPDQQAELAVGNHVEFQLHDGLVRWHLGAHAGAQGVVVRGRSGAAQDVDEVGTPLDLPPLSRMTGEGEAVSIPPPPPRRHRDTAWDLPSVMSTPPPLPSSQPDWLVTSGQSESPSSRMVPDPPDFAMRRPPTGEPPATLGDALEDEIPVGRNGRGSDPFGELAARLSDGSLCLARGHGNGERLARHLGAYALILEPSEANGRRFDAAVGAFVLRLDDPSELLGWALRRVEEGARVIVETAAKTPAGGRRVLLGVSHNATAIEWLASVPTFWLADERGSWTLTRA